MAVGAGDRGCEHVPTAISPGSSSRTGCRRTAVLPDEADRQRPSTSTDKEEGLIARAVEDGLGLSLMPPSTET